MTKRSRVYGFIDITSLFLGGLASKAIDLLFSIRKINADTIIGVIFFASASIGVTPFAFNIIYQEGLGINISYNGTPQYPFWWLGILLVILGICYLDKGIGRFRHRNSV